MTNEIQKRYSNPMDVPILKNGLTPLLSASLEPQALAKHRAMIGVELELLAQKCGRYKWDDFKETPLYDRMVADWMDALQDYPLSEIQEACRLAIMENPNKMPNEGHVKNHIAKIRKAKFVKPTEPAKPRHVSTQEERANIRRLLADVGFIPKGMQ